MQVYDYGLAIKTSNWHLIKTELYGVFMVICSLHSAEYEKNVYLQLASLKWLENTEHPMFELIKKNPHTCNGEDVEISNSHISRLSSSSSVRSKVEDVEKMFILQPVFRNAKLTMTSANRDDDNETYHADLSESHEVTKATEFLLALAQRIRTRTLRPYRKLAKKEKYGTREYEMEQSPEVLIAPKSIKIKVEDVPALIRRVHDKAKTGVMGRHVRRRRRVQADNSSDGSVEEDEEEENRNEMDLEAVEGDAVADPNSMIARMKHRAGTLGDHHHPGRRSVRMTNAQLERENERASLSRASDMARSRTAQAVLLEAFGRATDRATPVDDTPRIQDEHHQTDVIDDDRPRKAPVAFSRNPKNTGT